MFTSIKTKVIAIYSLVIITFTSLLLLITFINQYDDVIELELESSTKLSELHASVLSQEFKQYVSMLQIVSKDSLVKSGNMGVIREKLNSLIEVSNGDFVNAIYVDQTLFLTDAFGKSNQVVNPLFKHGDQWKNQEFNISQPIYSEFEEKPVVMVAVPILNEKGEWTGTIAVAVQLKFFTDKLSSIKLKEGSYSWLSDAKGLIVSHPDERLVLKANINNLGNFNYTGFSAVVKETKLKPNGYGRYSDEGNNEPNIVTFAKVDYLPGWNLFVSTKESEVFQEIYHALYEVLISSFVLMLIFLLLVRKLANKITQPIVQLTKDAELSVEQKKNCITVANSKDEIEHLSKAFYNAIQKNLVHRIHLEEVVHLRTQEILEKNNKLKEIASKDPLTGLFNRRAFASIIEKEMSLIEEGKSTPTLVIFDIDHFKEINDTYGHSIGDEILSILSDKLSSYVSDDNIICRWGGEEFVILVSKSPSNSLISHLDNIREKISRVDFSPVDKLTVSIGVATIKAGDSFEAWFNRADAALYKAKSSGRNCIVTG